MSRYGQDAVVKRKAKEKLQGVQHFAKLRFPTILNSCDDDDDDADGEC